MSDYEVTIINQSDNSLTYFALLSYCNLVIFDDAVKETKQKKIRIMKVMSLKKNSKLENFLKEQKIINVKWMFKTRLKKSSSFLNWVFKNICLRERLLDILIILI